MNFDGGDGIKPHAHAIAEVPAIGVIASHHLPDINGEMVVNQQSLEPGLKLGWDAHAAGKIIAAPNAQHT